MFDFAIFCHLLELMAYIEWRPPCGYLKSFVLSFLFFLFFPFLFFIFIFIFLFLSLSLSGFPLAPGAPGHCPPMPPSRYATDQNVGVTDEFENAKRKNKILFLMTKVVPYDAKGTVLRFEA